MPYTPPEQWSHGDYPTAAKLNQYKTGLDAIHDQLGDVDRQWPSMHLANEYHSHWLINRYRYLVYRGTGVISDPNNDFDSVSLSDSGGNWLTYDLSSVEWIVPGKLYEVQGVTEAYEQFSGT